VGFIGTFGSDYDTENKSALVNANAGGAQRALMNDSKEHEAVAPCISDVSLFIGLNRSDEDLKLLAQNIWHLSKDYGWSHDKAFDAMIDSTDPGSNTSEHAPFLFISNESAKDPYVSLKHPGKSTSEVIAVVKFDLFQKWVNTTHESRERSEVYLALKEKLTESYLNAFYLHFPLARGHVCFTSLGTPLTMNKFLGRSKGEVYGLDHTISRFDTLSVQRALHPQTSTKNLYMTGENVLTVSVTVCMISGYVTAARISWRYWFDTLPFVVQGLAQMCFE